MRIAVAAWPTAEAAQPAQPVTTIGLAALAKRAFDGEDLTPLSWKLIERMIAEPRDAAALMDLSIIEQLAGNRSDGLDLQARALEQTRLYRRPTATEGGLRLLAFMAPGDFMANTPLEFLLDGSDVTLDMLYVERGALPAMIPEHDLAFVAVGESEENRELLKHVASLIQDWPRPVLNAPERIARLSRDGAWGLLRSAPGLVIPQTVRVDRAVLAQIDGGTRSVGSVLESGAFPIIARPIGSHASEGLAKLDSAAAIGVYLEEQPEAAFFIAPFIDYRSADGLFRKYRIALIGGRPYVSHMGVSSHWMIHYLDAGMRESVEKRAEEAQWMATFEEDFARRHDTAFRALTDRVGLDYFAIDCAETPDDSLLIFEADVAMIVHSMDPEDIFPYRPPHMLKLFEAFRAILGKAAG